MSFYFFGLEIEMRHYLYILQVLISEAMFSVFFKRKNYFFLRVCLIMPVFLLLSLTVPVFLNSLTRYNLIVVYLFSLMIFPVCFLERFEDMFFCCTAALIIQNISYNTGLLACILFHVPLEIADSQVSRWIQLSVYVFVHVICFFLCVVKLRNKRRLGIQFKKSGLMALVSFMVLYFLEGVVFRDGISGYWPVRLLFVMVDILVLVMLFGLRYITENEEDRRLLEQLISQEYEQYKMQEDTIELLRMKSHDIKHIISLLKDRGDIKLDGAIEELEDVNTRYNNIVQTGNATLDVILTQKKNICYRNGIQMTYTIDGEILNFMTPENIAAIFANILDNAIQYLVTVEDTESRLLSLTVQRRLHFIVIHIENYCSDNRFFDGDLPMTTKGDMENHGYGLKSVRYVVKKYGGTMTVRNGNNLFNVDITIPYK